MSHLSPSIVSYIDTIKGGFFMRKKIMVLLICTVSLVSIPFSVIAAEKNVHTNVAVEQIMPRYGNISQISGNIQAVSGKINCSVDVLMKTSISISVKMSLQKKNGSSWNTVKSWNKSYSNTKVVNSKAVYNSTTGATYRMKYTVTAGNDKATGTTPSVVGKK